MRRQVLLAGGAAHGQGGLAAGLQAAQQLWAGNEQLHLQHQPRDGL
jgi:hypothetical protein